MTQTIQKKRLWQDLILHPNETHHLIQGQEAYKKRFYKALKFHAPGLAPVKDQSGAYHIDVYGQPAYSKRYRNVFGFYDNLAAVESHDGCFHIQLSGEPLYPERYAWAGNFQENRCVVKDANNKFYHINNQGQKTYSKVYGYAGDYKDGFAVVQNEQGNSTHIDQDGNLLHYKWFLDLDVFHKGFARALDHKGWFHVDKQGHEAYPQRFKNVEPFYNGISRCETFGQGIVLIEESGRVIHTVRGPLQDPFHQASALLIPFWKTEALKCAFSLGLFELLPSSFEKIEEKTRLKPSGLKALLNALCEMDLFCLSKDMQYQLTECGVFFQKENPHSLASALELFLLDSDHQEAWSHLKDCLIHEKDYFNLYKKDSYFSHIQSIPAKKQLYHKALSTYSKRDYELFVPFFTDKKHHAVIDVGGSSGALLNQILTQDKYIKGILLDLPQTASLLEFDPLVASRIQIVEQCFFKDWNVEPVDSIILSRILHDWSDDEALQILNNAKGSLEPSQNSSIYILEFLLEKNQFNGHLLDLNMRVMTSGKERSLDEYKSLLEKVGLKINERLQINEVCSVIVAQPNTA